MVYKPSRSTLSEPLGCLKTFSYHFGKEGLGLIYGRVKEEVHYVSICRPTRTFESPYLYSPPSMPDSQTDLKQEKERNKEYEMSEKKRLQYEIEQLKIITTANKITVAQHRQ